jgi:hypothetical protein
MPGRVVSVALAVVTIASMSAAFTATPSFASSPARAYISVGGSPLSSITTSPMALTPAFSQATHDYLVRCQIGFNNTIFTLTAASGTITVNGTTGPTATVTLSLLENQLVDVDAADPSNPSGPHTHYYVRCLPHDFPLITVNKPGNPTPGWYLTSNIINTGQTALYAMVLDNNAVPVWYAPTPKTAVNVELLPNNTLAWAPLSGPGVGADPNAAFSLYRLDTQTTTLQANPIVPMDFHELLQLSNGNRMLIATPLKTGVTLPPGFSTANGTMVDCIVEEVGPTGNLVWSWDAFNHIAPSETTRTTLITYNGQTVADIYHCNSIDVDPSVSDPSTADVLLSIRNLDAVVRINRANTQIPNGKILWKLGGSPVNQDGAQILTIQGDPETTIYGQHDARFQPAGHVSIYDDHSGQTGAARGLEYNINTTAGTAALVVQFPSPDGLNSTATGSFRRYENGGDNVISWGFKAGVDMNEVDGTGRPLLDMTMDGTAYRFVKVPLSAIDANLLRDTAGCAGANLPGCVTGMLRVVSSPALPTQILVDGQIADTWGLNWLKIAPGNHAVCFLHVEGYTEPACQTATVNSGVTTVVTGTFIQRGSLRVVTSPAVASQITVDGNPTNDWGMFTDIPTGSHTVCFGAVAGYNPPACQTATVTAGSITTITGTFTTNPNAVGQSGLGKLRVVTSPPLNSQISLQAGAGSPYIADTWGLNFVEVPPGSYTVSFTHREGYADPAPQTVTVTAGATTTVTGSFTQRGALRVITSPAAAGTISVDAVSRDDWGMWTDIPTGSHQVCFGPAPPYANTPPCQTVTVTAGVETDVTGTYS